MAARFLQAQQNHLSGTNLPELALHQQLFGHQLLQQKILEEQLARNRDFFLVSEQAEREKHAGHLGLIFHQVSYGQIFDRKLCFQYFPSLNQVGHIFTVKHQSCLGSSTYDIRFFKAIFDLPTYPYPILA